MQANLFDKVTPLETEKHRVMEEARDKGCDCPVCGQFVKVYKRKINSFMARQLIHMHKNYGNGQWVHARNLVLGSTSCGDLSKLSYWGLIQKQPHNEGDDGKKTSGFWRITDKGNEFAAGRGYVEAYAMVYNGRCLELTGEPVTIQQCLGDKFDYMELMYV